MTTYDEIGPARSTRLGPVEAEAARRVIESLAGPGARLRPDQEAAVAALSSPAARVLVVQATGWGKSAVYWVAAAARRAAGAGPALVVSPLLSLMRDQVGAARRAGLAAEMLNSANRERWQEIEAALAADEVDVLLVSPERLANPVFGARVLERLTGRLGLVVVDEAHAVSDWGHDFRPDYRRVADLLRKLNPDTPVLATTATANARVSADVADQLGESTVVLRGPLARASLDLAVVPGLDPLSRYAWLVEHLPRLPGSGIVYTLTVADAHRLAMACHRRYGTQYPVAAYTGQLPAPEREALEDDLRENRLKALIATSALGMGYDKPDLGFVVHVGAPPSPVSYYQQVGRAGRAIERAVVALLPGDQDERVWEYFATASLPDPGEVRRLLAVLPTCAEEAMSLPALEAESGLRRTRVELLLKQLAVDEVTTRAAQGWWATGRTWEYDEAHYAGILAARHREASIMREYIAGGSCLMSLLQRSLDDASARPCGRCSVCRGALPAGWAPSPSAEAVAAVRQVLREQTNVWEPRKMWPGGAFGSRGRIAAAQAVSAGRVIVHADAPEWSPVLNGSLAGRAAVEPELADAAVQVLARWQGEWPTRPEVIVSLDAARLPGVALSVASHLGTVGRLPTLSWHWEGAPPPSGSSSAQRASIWRERLADGVPDGLSGQAVLLVVDASATGWSVTVAGSLLRSAGARVVMPLVVHRRVG